MHIEENTASIIFVFNSETKTIEARPVVNDESQLNEPTEHSTEPSTDEATAVTADNPTDATNPTNAITATTNTTATTATGATVKPAIASTSEGKPENGAGGIIAIAVGVIILAGAGVVIIGKKKAK